MRAFSALSAVLSLAATALALTVTSPGQDTTWDASTRSQSISWSSVATDPSNFTISLINMVRPRGFFSNWRSRLLIVRSVCVLQQSTPNVNVVLKQNVTTSSDSTSVDAPSSGWPTGQGFQINLVQQNPTGVNILAQSQQFNITGTTTPFSSVVSSST